MDFLGTGDKPLAARQAAVLQQVETMRGRLCRGEPSDHEVLSLLAELCHSAGIFERAGMLLREAEALAPLNPPRRLLQARICISLGLYAPAVELLDQLLGETPFEVDLLHQRGVAAQALGRYEEALVYYERVLMLDPRQLRSRFNRGLARLSLGDYAKGFRDLEGRQVGLQRSPSPLWLGAAPVLGRRIRVWADQGLGDSLQYARYLPLLVQRGARVSLQVQPSLVRLLGSIPGLESVQSMEEAPPPHEMHCPLGSLPFAFDTRADTIPQWQLEPPGLRSSTQAEASTCAPGTGRLRVGLCWSGNALALHNSSRRLPLELCEPLLRLETIQLVNLRPELTQAEAEWLKRQGAELPDLRGDFLDTARLLAGLDLVISVDTAMAHLAGTLGLPVWVPLAVACDWRWAPRSGLWYPTARLFRQTQPGDWSSVVSSLREALEEKASERA